MNMKKKYSERIRISSLGSPRSLITLAAFTFLTIVVVRSAWVCDDAYFTARTLDNWVNGYGLTWNVGERVQAYTHPLWLFLISAPFFISHSFYLSAILISIVLSLATVLFLITRLSVGRWTAIIFISALVFSKAWIDYSTSGLENPLLGFLLIGFIYFYIKESSSPQDYLRLVFIASLILLTRMDAILLVIPALVQRAKDLKVSQLFRLTIVGIGPFLLWEIFSLVYYGVPLPNTAYAKLATGIDQSQLIKQGMLYFIDSFSRDPITLLMVTLAMLMSFISENRRLKWVGAGIVLYGLYILIIGGDFMSGRFFSIPLVLSLAILGQVTGVFDTLSAGILLSGLIAVIGFSAPNPTLQNNISSSAKAESLISHSGIADERRYYSPATGLINIQHNHAFIMHEWAREGLLARTNGETLIVRRSAGFFGYYAGPEVYILELYSLTDPLLSRLPVEDEENWRIGHFERKIPDGYIETLQTGKNMISDPNLHLFYSKIRLIVRGDLWDRDRIKAIWNLNMGKYRELIAVYVETL